MKSHLSTLKNKRNYLMKKLQTVNYFFIRGSISTIKHKCSNKKCLCHSGGEKHPGIYFTSTIDKKTKIVYLGNKKQTIAKNWMENYSKIKSILDRLNEINIQILKFQDF